MLELISDYIGAFVTFLSGIIFVRYILNERVNINFFLVIILVIFNSLIMELLYFYDIGILRAIAGYLLYAILFKFVFGLNINKAFWYSFIFYVILFTSEIFVFLFVPVFFNGSLDYIFSYIANSFLINLIISLFLLMLSYIFRHWIIKFSNIKFKFGIIIYWKLSFVSVVMFFFVAFKNNTFNLGTYFVLIIIVVMLIVVFNLFIQAYKNEQLTIKYDKMLEFIKKYEIEIENQRTYRHETKNQLLTIKSKIIDNDKCDNIIKYIDEIIKDNNVIVNHSEYARLRYLPSNGIKGLFYFKVSEAVEKGINIDINISKCIEDSFIKSLNSVMFNQLGKVLGIFLDNAIEGAFETCSKSIGIEIYCDDGDICFIISNTYGKIVNNNGYFSLSTKGVGRGHGLMLAKRIIDGNNHFINYTEVTDKLYIQKLIIKK